MWLVYTDAIPSQGTTVINENLKTWKSFHMKVRNTSFPFLDPVDPQQQQRSLHVPQLVLSWTALAFSRLTRTPRAQGCVWVYIFRACWALQRLARLWESPGNLQKHHFSSILSRFIGHQLSCDLFLKSGVTGKWLTMEDCNFCFIGEIPRDPWLSGSGVGMWTKDHSY